MESNNDLMSVNETKAPVLLPDADARSRRKTFSAYQHTIYMNGTRGVLPPLTTNPNGWEAAAKSVSM